MKIGILGNSHVASLKQAWDRIGADHPTIEMVFFAHRGTQMSGMQAVAGKLVPDNPNLREAIIQVSGGRPEFDPAEYDAIVIYGLGASVFIFDEEGPYSKKVMTIAAENLAKNNVSYTLLERLVGISSKPIYIGHNPFIAAYGAITHEGAEKYLASVERLNKLIYQPMGARLLPQPSIVNGDKTDPIYAKGAPGLRVEANAQDTRYPDHHRLHMNDAFGELWLGQFLPLIETAPASTSAKRRHPKSRRGRPD